MVHHSAQRLVVDRVREQTAVLADVSARPSLRTLYSKELFGSSAHLLACLGDGIFSASQKLFNLLEC